MLVFELVFGVALIFVGLMGVFSFDDLACGLGFVSLAMGGILLFCFFSGLSHQNSVDHKKAVKDLRKEGFVISSDNLSISTDTVTIETVACKVTYHIKKLNDKYRVVVKRTDRLGGGNLILTPLQVISSQNLLCQEK